jgi:hypothetical protein
MVEIQGQNEKELNNLHGGNSRKPYIQPKLIEYGSIEKMTTQGKTGGSMDGASSRRK